jgi:hypothetical protein
VLHLRGVAWFLWVGLERWFVYTTEEGEGLYTFEWKRRRLYCACVSCNAGCDVLSCPVTQGRRQLYTGASHVRLDLPPSCLVWAEECSAVVQWRFQCKHPDVTSAFERARVAVEAPMQTSKFYIRRSSELGITVYDGCSGEKGGFGGKPAGWLGGTARREEEKARRVMYV